MTSIWEVAESLRQAAVVRVVMMKAFAPGDVLVLESDRLMTLEERERTRQRFESIMAESGLRIVLLEPGMHVVAREEHAIGGAP